ncbi:MAG: PEP-CTERM sorting domain-containing protein [Rhodanobacteraceae bacterium]
MKPYWALALAAFVLVLVAPSALAIRVIFDPPPPQPLTSTASPSSTDCTQSANGLNNYTPCNIRQADTPYTVAFVGCSTLSGLNPQVTGGWCLYLDNVTGGPLSTFTFQFSAPGGGSLDGTNELSCSSRPAGFASDNCPDNASFNAGDPLNLTFFAPIANNTNFYLITDFNNQPDPASVTAAVPEPGELGLFGLGLLVLGVGYGWQRRRQRLQNP